MVSDSVERASDLKHLPLSVQLAAFVTIIYAMGILYVTVLLCYSRLFHTPQGTLVDSSYLWLTALAELLH